MLKKWPFFVQHDFRFKVHIDNVNRYSTICQHEYQVIVNIRTSCQHHHQMTINNYITISQHIFHHEIQPIKEKSQDIQQ